MVIVPKSVFLAISEAFVSESTRNVQKSNVHKLDIRAALATGLHRLVVRTRKVRLNLWSGNVAVEESVTTVEPTDARH
jgi:hypothetical protein